MALNCFRIGFWRQFLSSPPCRLGIVLSCSIRVLPPVRFDMFFFQIMGLISNMEVPFPDGVSYYIKLASVAQLNLEVMQHSCIFGEHAYAYYDKVRIFFWLPVFLGSVSCFIYGARLAFWRLRPMAAEPSAASELSESATDHLERFRDQLCSVSCYIFNLVYAFCKRPASVVDMACALLAGTHRSFRRVGLYFTATSSPMGQPD